MPLPQRLDLVDVYINAYGNLVYISDEEIPIEGVVGMKLDGTFLMTDYDTIVYNHKRDLLKLVFFSEGQSFTH